MALGAAVLNVVPRARARIEAEDRFGMVLLSLLWVGVPFTLFPLAEQLISSAVTGMLNGAMPIFAAIVAGVLLRSPPGPTQAAGLVVGLAGTIAVSLAVWTAPFGLWSISGSSFELGPVLSVAFIGAVGTGIAFVVMATLVGSVGSTRASMATYLIPVVAMVLGVLVRDEEVGLPAVLGVALVVAGAYFASRPEQGVATASTAVREPT